MPPGLERPPLLLGSLRASCPQSCIRQTARLSPNRTSPAKSSLTIYASDSASKFGLNCSKSLSFRQKTRATQVSSERQLAIIAPNLPVIAPKLLKFLHPFSRGRPATVEQRYRRRRFTPDPARTEQRGRAAQSAWMSRIFGVDVHSGGLFNWDSGAPPQLFCLRIGSVRKSVSNPTFMGPCFSVRCARPQRREISPCDAAQSARCITRRASSITASAVGPDLSIW